MSKRIWLNLILLLAVAGLIALIMNPPGSKEQAQQQTRQRLFETAPYQATSILIQRDSGNIRLQKDEDEWQLTEPGRAPVDQDRIKHLLTILQEPFVAEYKAEGKDMATFGLDPGKIRLTINSEQATFGTTNPVTLNRYILKDNTIYTIKEIVYGVLGSSVTNLLTHYMLPKNSIIEEIQAPQLFSHLPDTFWLKSQAVDIADYLGDETTIGRIRLGLQNQFIVVLDVLAIKPVLVLGREDLKVKYTFDEETTSLLNTNVN